METKKEDKLEDITLRSDSVQDVLSNPPHWMIQWGNTVIMTIIALIVIMSYIIKYPEFVSSAIVVTSLEPPEKIEARSNSKIEKIFVKDHQYVDKNQILMVLLSIANYKDILILDKVLDSISATNLLYFPISKTNSLKLGEIQGEYNNFIKALQNEKLFIDLQPYAPDNIVSIQLLSQYKDRVGILNTQKKIEQSKYELITKSYLRSSELFKKGVISSLELEAEKMKCLEAEQSLQNINISLSQIQESIVNINKNKRGTKINIEKDKVNYSSQSLQSFEQLRKALNQWKQDYLIKSSSSGIISFQQFWGENQFVKAGNVVISILPKERSVLIGRMLIPSINSGKVKKDQKVLIKLDNYQYQEYGVIVGKVQNTSLTPDEKGNYYVDIVLPNGLNTSYHKKLSFDRELSGSADIITEDLRLIERFLYQIRKLIGYQI